jgi:hypothetical protein
MRVPAKLAAFGAVLVAAFAIGFGIGGAVGPLDEPAPAAPSHEEVHP